MKAASNKNESKKRKRDESQEPIPESTKKAKVHAQRKFAQGAAFNSPVITPIKDKVRPSAAVSSSGPILTGKCPNTEDFLTFLCFRRTSILPAKLDFFKDGFGSEPESAGLKEKTDLTINHKPSPDNPAKQSSKKNEKHDEGKKMPTPAVQALRRKYQEQRLAKEKPTNVTRLAKKVKGKNMVRTRSSAVGEETKTAARKQEKESKSNSSGLRSGLKRIQPVGNKINKKSVKPKHSRAGLRSGGSVSQATARSSAKPTQDTKSAQATTTTTTTTTTAKKAEKETKKPKTEVPETKTKPVKAKKTEGFSDFSSDDNEPLLAVKKFKSGAKSNPGGKSVGAKAAPPSKTSVKTRASKDEGNSSKALLRPTRKTKEAAALYMEMITKKLVSPEKSGDDDMSSVESFPELPNAKRTEQRETEIKAKALAPKRTEEKPKETKKAPAKKSNNDQITKNESKQSKDSSAKVTNVKKETKTKAKQEESKGSGTPAVKRSSRTSGKGESATGKLVEEEKKEPSRPSTRSRPQETAPLPKKSLGKTVPKKKVKEAQKEQEKRPSDKPEPGGKSKASKEEKCKPKTKTEQTDTPEVKKSSQKDTESTQKSAETGKPTRKTVEKKQTEKNETAVKAENPGKRGRKPSKPVETNAEVKKPKPAEKKLEKKVKKAGTEEETRDDVNISKRPTRKCSTADKIWIDIDGFTSDEDDFVDVSPMTKTRGSSKKGNAKNEIPTQKPEPEKKQTKVEATQVKTKNQKESGGKTEEKKLETKKAKVETKPSGEAPAKGGTGKKTEGKSTKNEESAGKGSEKRDTGPKTEKKVKTEVKQETDSKKSEKPSEEAKKSNKDVAQESVKIVKKETTKTLDVKTQKKLSQKKPKIVKTRSIEAVEKGEEEEDEEEEVEESRSKKRTRPVRQCSTGEKRWIETDSDFSFYESSDDEDNLPIVDFSKVKSSPDRKTGEGKTDTQTQTDKKEEDNFSESDEEPLKKKAHIEETAKKVEPEAKPVGKVQREVPALTPLKKPSEVSPVVVNIPPEKQEEPQLSATIPTEPKPPPPTPSYDPPQPQPLMQQVETPKFLPDPSPVSVPNRIEMILHSLKRDKTAESTSSRSNDVKVTFGNVPYQPIPHSSQVSCTYQVKTTFPSPREPISTHGLDLLSEVALPTTPKENITSQTKRIEKWLNDSLTADQKDRFHSYETIGDRVPQPVVDKPPPETGFYLGKPSPTKVSSQADFGKFGQMELFESQKLLKKNLFAGEGKQDAVRSDQQQTTPKKAVTSVQDLLKLQKERREATKATDNTPHLKNCKCNSCVVKKGWFKNKPVPKTGQQKSSPSEEPEENTKPFESLTKAFIGDGKNSKMSVSVAPMVVSPPATPTSSKDDSEKKGTVQQRKLSFLERMKERERKEAAAAAAKPSPNAFSPSNESSVYAFEPEPEQPGKSNAPPFRSKRDSRTPSTSRSDDEGLKICEEESPPTSAGTQVEIPGGDKSAKPSLSASIAVQVNLDSETVAEVEPPPEQQDGKSIEISTQTEVAEEDSDSPMFYIPLQPATATGTSANPDGLIQGVALKLGTEGPMGPNQRVIMKAKLVTKPPESGSIKAVVMPQPKRMFDQKYNNPPIGTVQPTTRKPPDAVKSESAKSPVVPTAKDNQEPQQAESESGKTGKTAGKPVKNKEKTVKPETTEENLPCTSASASKPKRPTKQKSTEAVINPTNSTWLPPAGTASKLVEAPTFHPTEKDFQDPFEFFDRIRPAAEKFGLCRIVPPNNFKPDCKVSDDMRFTAYNQYIHRMFHRWGPNIKEMMAIKKYLATQSISLKQPPWIGGIEVDLPRLYQSVQNCGGLMKVMEKKKWHQVADMMKIPKAAQDRVTKLDDIYCKYLLPYDTLSHDERQKLFDEVERDWEERQKAPVESQDSTEGEEGEENYIEECEECVVKGRNMALNQFYRIARNTMSMWFRNPEPSHREVETEFWKHVSEGNHHVCVHSGSIDSSGWGYGFPVAKNNSFSKHPWNLKVLTNNSGSVLRYLGPVMGVTVPTLHVGMVFTAFCWYRDPHGLPWIEYLHTGAPKIWYGISDDNSNVFREALKKLLPRYIKNKTIWLPSDTAMIPPEQLVEHGVSLCHTVQEPGQFILVFPRAFTSSICTGYLVSESVYFAQLSWLATAEQVFKDIQESCEPSMFSLEKLLFSVASDSRSSVEVLKQVLPMIWHVRQKEIDGRKTLSNLGLKSSERLPAKEAGNKKKKGRWTQEEDGDYECEICRTNLYVSLVTNSQEEGVYCLPHAIDLLTQKRHQLKYCKLMYTYTQEEMNEMVEKLEQRIENKCQKKPQSKPSTSAK